MSLRYCLACKKICDEYLSLVTNDHYVCKRCKKPLVYFGKEHASISLETILAEYDALNPYNPLADFSGLIKDYENLQVDIGVLECEEILKYDPQHYESLRYLAKHFWAKREVKKSLSYMEKMTESQLKTADDVTHYINLLLSQKNYPKIIAILTQYQHLTSEFIFFHFNAVCLLGLNKLQESLGYFYQAYHVCKDEKRQQKIKKMIRYLSTILDKPVS